MQYILVAALVFGVCYLVDKGFTKIFRGQVQHASGKSVRLPKRYSVIGLILTVLGIAAVVNGLSDSGVLFWGGLIVLLTGLGLITYYMTFGIFYDEDSFIVTTFGKKSTTYRYRDIRGQQLYLIQGGNVVVELHMQDSRTVSLQATMEGVYPFLDHAFAAWCQQTGRDPENCPFHDPENSLWFPKMEDL